MKKEFEEYCPLTEEKIKDIWHNGLIIPDTNVLLNLYRYTEKTRENFIKLLEHESIVESIWLPYQVAYEFHKNRASVIAEQDIPEQKIRSMIKKHINNLIEEIRKYNIHRYHPYIDIKEITNKILSNKEDIYAFIEQKSATYPNLISNDYILNKIHELFKENVGEKFTEDKISELKEKANDRYEKEIPPGYEDKEKDGDDKYGDYLIWIEIINKAKIDNRPVIFINDEKKEDWWQRVKGKTIGARPELRKEFKEKTNNIFLLYNPVQFMKYANNFINETESEGSKEAINEVRNFMNLKSSIKIRNNKINNDNNDSKEEKPTIDEMVNWFYENYEDPANSVPYESREGGYQYYAGGPYDPMEELQHKFPEASFNDIEEAVNIIYEDCFDWVKKGQY